ncbi:hypothetical protein PF008_g13684 [Phytophthora fragariae]|uniref:Uncharacterized protein n=1 Tax=Phytophthora fragariae TaxID=53985 RepID=A0A6G0RKM3_9STRA|nr:hypothetical protein PF008_g13684 [Phytophthora fragariae]
MAPDVTLGDEAVSSLRTGDSADTTPGSRKNFTVEDDLSFLRCVNLVRPWEAAVGTSNGIMRAFDMIAEKCRSVPGFVMKDGPALRTRFDCHVRVFRAQQRTSMRSSGTSEEYRERDVLLQDAVCRMDNWKEESEKDKALERSKKEGIESSGHLMRRLAMAEMEDEDNPSDNEEESTVTNSSQKRAAPRGNRRTHKPSKREKLSVIRDSIAQAKDG